MRILFIGCVESSYRLLSALIENHKNVVGVITKEQSSINSDFVSLKPLCDKYNIPCHFVNNVNDEDGVEFVKSCSPDIGYCFGWSQLIKQELISIFPLGIVGFHPAALPLNRGRHPIIWALALGLSETASSFFMINIGADEGDIISQKRIEISYHDDAKTLYDKIMIAAVEQELIITNQFEQGQIEYIPQDSTKGNSWRKRNKADGEIDWRMASRGIYNLVRSLTKPYVGAHFVIGGNEYKVWKVQEIDTISLENIEPGKVISINGDGTIDIKAGIGGIRLIDFDNIENIKEGDYL